MRRCKHIPIFFSFSPLSIHYLHPIHPCKKTSDGSTKLIRSPPPQMATSTSYSCICNNGTSPDLGAYQNTYVSDICQARFAVCRTQNPGSQACVNCGTLKADDVPASTSSSAAASTAAATSMASGTATGGAATTTSGAPSSGGNMLVGAEMGVKGAVGLLAAMGLVL